MSQITQKNNLRVVITGATGFVGSPLSESLAGLGCEVLAIARTIPIDIERKKTLCWLEADLSSPETYQAEVKSFYPEVLIHLAWQDIPDFSLNKSRVNLDQSIEFLTYIVGIESCKKILFSGSCWEYNKVNGECLETDIVEGSKNHFTWAKNSLRIRAEMLCRQKSISFAWFRIFYVYGPGQRLGSLLPSILTHLKKGKLPQINSPHNANDYIFIDDVVEAFTIATNCEVSSGIYNLGSGISTTALEVCRNAERIVLNSSNLTKQLEIKSQSKVSDENYWAEMTSTNEGLNWNPKTQLFDGIKLTWKNFNS